jgi:DNA-binding XRE family transcriptional regulator
VGAYLLVLAAFPAVYTRLRVVRTERSLSRKALAEAVGVHYQTIGYIERGEYSPSLDLALRLARHFELPVEALFSLDPFPPSIPGRSWEADPGGPGWSRCRCRLRDQGPYVPSRRGPTMAAGHRHRRRMGRAWRAL